MLKNLSKARTGIFYFDTWGERILGVHGGIKGDISRISGNVSEIFGDC